MNKKTLKIAGLALGLSMAVAGIGAAVSASLKAPLQADATAVPSSTPLSDTMEAGKYILTFVKSEKEYYLSGFNNSHILYTELTGSIEAVDTDNAFTIAASGTGWSINMDSLSKYLGWSSKTNFAQGSSSSTDAYRWTITLKDGSTTEWGIYNLGTPARLWGDGGSDIRPYQNQNQVFFKFYPVEEPKEISSVDIKTQPTKLEYKVGDAFDPAGLVVTLTYSDSSTKDIAYGASNASKFTFTGFDSSAAADDQNVTVKYSEDGENEFTCATKVVVDIINVTATGLTINAESVKAAYRVGEKLNLAGLVATVTYSDSSNDVYNIASNADFLAKGFTLKLSDAAFDLDTELAVEHDGVSFDVYYGELYDASHGLGITVENLATLDVVDNATTFYKKTQAYTDMGTGIVGNGTTYAAFKGMYYRNAGFQMNSADNNSYLANAIEFGRIKTITITASTAKASKFTMYYGASAMVYNGAAPSATTITVGDPESQTFVYDFSAVETSFFCLAKTEGDNCVLKKVSIDFYPNASLDRSQGGAYSAFFLATTNGLCDADGIENGVSGVWEQLSGTFGLLTEATKAALKDKAIAEKGISDGTTIGEAMARYYWAINNHENEDFVGGGDILASIRSISLGGYEMKNSVLIAVIVAIAGLAAAGGLFVFHKRKQN